MLPGERLCQPSGLQHRTHHDWTSPISHRLGSMYSNTTRHKSNELFLPGTLMRSSGDAVHICVEVSRK